MSIPTVNEIRNKLRAIPDYKQTSVFGISVTRWPGWDDRPYEIETMAIRPGWGESYASRIISEMLNGVNYHEAVRKVTGRNISKPFNKGKSQ
jgi:hypothetical protein